MAPLHYLARFLSLPFLRLCQVGGWRRDQILPSGNTGRRCFKPPPPHRPWWCLGRHDVCRIPRLAETGEFTGSTGSACQCEFAKGRSGQRT